MSVELPADRAVPLSLATLPEISGRAAVPAYERRQLSAGMLHFGVGNFHRAHQAVYLDDLFNAGRDLGWGIVGAGVLDSDRRGREVLAAQDFLTTVVEQSAGASSARVTGAMIDHLEPGNTAAIVERLSDPAIRIVSTTVTEGGYFIDPATGAFDPEHPAIVADSRSPDAPRTVFGLIAAGLKIRRSMGLPAFTVMSCDNIPHNGAVARSAVAGLARLTDPAFADWVEQEVSFPNGMVDRITPATGDRERGICRDEYGIEDGWPVFCEDFRQWVLEDDFPSGRPALEDVGVEFVADVSAYENMKIRILNGGHALIAYPAGLMGIEFAHEAMENPIVRGFLEKVERTEIIPVVPPVPGVDLGDYFQLVMHRFANPKIGDTVRRLCLDGSNRQPKFIIPSVNDHRARGSAVDGLALASALWCRYCYGTTDAGAVIEPNDPDWVRLTERAKLARDEPDAWLGMSDIYGDVGRAAPFRAAFGDWLRRLWSHGTERTIKDYLAD